MKNKIIKIVALALIIFSGQSCTNYLDVVPDGVATVDIAFNSRVNAERYLFSVYSYMPQHASTNNPGILGGDEIWVNDFVSRTWDGINLAKGNQGVTSPLLNYWGDDNNRKLYIALRDCNIFLDNIDKPKDLEPFERDRWIAEVKFLKAYYHFWLLRMYGPITVIETNTLVSASVEEVRLPRQPVDVAVDYIVSLLDEAIPLLPALIQNNAEELGRITQPIAAAIKAQVLVTAASPLFNGNQSYAGYTNKEGVPYFNPTYDETKWVKAAAACKEAIDFAHAAGHSLYTYPGSSVYDLSDSTILKMSLRGAVSEKWNPEVIWGDSNSRSAWLQSRALPRLDPNVTAEVDQRADKYWSPTLRMAEMFYTENGVPIEEDKNWHFDTRFELGLASDAHRFYVEPGYETVQLHFNREARFYSSLAFDGNIMYGHGRLNDAVDPWVVKAKSNQTARRVNNYQWSVTGYWPKKLVHVEDVLGSAYSREEYPWPVIRLADMYLLYAEALNEIQGPGESYQWINLVRERAGLKGVVESWSQNSKFPSKPTTKDGLREIIQKERMIELAFEGPRFWDLRRWKLAGLYMNTPIRGWDVNQKEAKAYYRVREVQELVFKERDYFWPISEGDLVVNPNLDQSPGW